VALPRRLRPAVQRGVIADGPGVRIVSEHSRARNGLNVRMIGGSLVSGNGYCERVIRKGLPPEVSLSGLCQDDDGQTGNWPRRTELEADGRCNYRVTDDPGTIKTPFSTEFDSEGDRNTTFGTRLPLGRQAAEVRVPEEITQSV
jgi:hypothetical protein